LQVANLVFISVITFYAIIAFPESPKYLYSKGKFNEARNALDYIARFNNQPFDKHQIMFETEKAQLDAANASTQMVENEEEETP